MPPPRTLSLTSPGSPCLSASLLRPGQPRCGPRSRGDPGAAGQRSAPGTICLPDPSQRLRPAAPQASAWQRDPQASSWVLPQTDGCLKSVCPSEQSFLPPNQPPSLAEHTRWQPARSLARGCLQRSCGEVPGPPGAGAAPRPLPERWGPGTQERPALKSPACDWHTIIILSLSNQRA